MRNTKINYYRNFVFPFNWGGNTYYRVFYTSDLLMGVKNPTHCKKMKLSDERPLENTFSFIHCFKIVKSNICLREREC